ncbi:SseB family protein [Histomonas meleagridis]|uniref:SseB family protein n=1 Tax=Histomonas meleagridis TaxID=135588 RepID=UPI00355A680B|nr:SseB family protein [Histomonas meleagridis]KAH0801412.1 SseB family protein [Histomonas meleagridis]
MLVEQDEDGKFIKSLLELQGQILYHLMSELCQVKGIEMPYSPNDYDVTRTQVSDDKFFVTLTMPEPLKMPHCRRVYILLNNDFSQKKYITVEKDMFTTDFMCGWDMSDGQVKHNNYGPSPENIQDEIEKVKTLFWD